MEAIGVLLTNRQPHWHDHGAEAGGVATTARQWGLPLALRHFGWGQRRPSLCKTLTTTEPRPRSG